MTVKLQLFSTRKDPTWEMDTSVVEYINTLWNNLQPYMPFEDHIPSLGYRGFEVTRQENSWLIFRQYVRLTQQDGSIEYRIDHQRVMENFLIRKTSPEVNQDIINYIEAGL